MITEVAGEIDWDSAKFYGLWFRGGVFSPQLYPLSIQQNRDSVDIPVCHLQSGLSAVMGSQRETLIFVIKGSNSQILFLLNSNSESFSSQACSYFCVIQTSDKAYCLRSHSFPSHRGWSQTMAEDGWKRGRIISPSLFVFCFYFIDVCLKKKISSKTKEPFEGRSWKSWRVHMLNFLMY